MDPQPQQMHRVRATARVEVSSDRGVFMISVAAELAGMHPQTLRMYESRGLIEPKRSPKGTRLYSHSDVERLKRIQEMTAELGLNLAGVERVVFASSNHVMGDYRHVGDGPITVDMTPMPDGPYGVTKLVGERLGRSLARAFDLTFIAIEAAKQQGAH